MRDERFIIPPPEPPDSPDAWYAPAIRAQYEITHGVVATIREQESAFYYDVRPPTLTTHAQSSLDRIRTHFEKVPQNPPLTREGAIERVQAGFSPKYQTVIDGLIECSQAERRRIEYYALSELRCLDELTPYALDTNIEVADIADGNLVVHLREFSPAETTVSTHHYIDRFTAHRLDQYKVTFLGYKIDVVRYREQLLGADLFETKYAVLEPDKLPGDEQLIEECKDRIWETGITGFTDAATLQDRENIVRDRAKMLLERRLATGGTRAWIESIINRMRTILSTHGITTPALAPEFSSDRRDDLVYYVLRDLVGHGHLTIPIRDPYLEDIEANRIGERVKVVPRGGAREPTNLVFETEEAFVNVVTQLTADDGVELSASRPSAKVNIDPPGVNQTIRCAVALPAISEDGPHISIRKQAPDVITPIDLVEMGSIPTELVTLLWMLYEHRGIVLFSGPTGAGKTTLMNAHMPFIDYADRPISIDEGSREVLLPHETGVSLTTRDHQDSFKRVSMADLMTETNYLNPDVQVIAEINTPASFETFGEILQTGHGVLGTTHAKSVETLINRVVEQGLPSYLLCEIDLVVFPKKRGQDRYVSEVVEILSDEDGQALSNAQKIKKDGTVLYANPILTRHSDNGWEFEFDGTSSDCFNNLEIRTFHTIADRTDRSVSEVVSEFHRKHDYVKVLVREEIDTIEELFRILADLRVDEAATVDRLRRVRG